MQLQENFDEILSHALKEDLGLRGDITTAACVPSDAQARAIFHIKQKGVIAGLFLLEPLFHMIDPCLKVRLMTKDGSFHIAGDPVAEITGNASGIMTGERCALNLLQHLSGIATTTAEYVKKLAGHSCEVMDTRKTLPGLRSLEKYAVKAGGGINHRFGLDDRFIIKSNHIAFSDHPPGKAIAEAVEKVKRAHPGLPVEVEVGRLDFFTYALSTAADAIIVHNLTPAEVEECVKKGHKANKKIYFESSVNLTPDGVLAYARAGADGIALGALTFSTQALDIGLRLSPIKQSDTVSKAHPSTPIQGKRSLMSKLFTKRSKEN